MNKKGQAGILSDNVLGMVIAALGIFVLVILLFNLYSIFQSSNESKRAETNMNHLIDDINSLKEGETTSFILLYPQGWVLTGWPSNPLLGEKKIPKKCLDNGWSSCICFCNYGKSFASRSWNAWVKQGTLIGTTSDYVYNCDQIGICKEIKGDVLVNAKTETYCTVPYFLNSNCPIVVDRVVNNGEHLTITKQKNKLVIYTKNG